MSDYNRPQRAKDQYLRPRAKEMIEELKVAMIPCTFTCVMPDNKIRINNIDHSGSVTHLCKYEKGHPGNCKCLCEKVEFKGFQ